MTEPRYIDEKLAKARRMYIENRINQEEGKGVWKGRLYFMVPYTVPLMGISMEVPDFLYSGRKEELETAGNMDSPFCVMVSEDRDISCTFYSGEESKTYNPDDLHQLFERLYPGNPLSPLNYGRVNKEICYFCYSNKWNFSQLYHIFFFLSFISI